MTKSFDNNVRSTYSPTNNYFIENILINFTEYMTMKKAGSHIKIYDVSDWWM